MIRSKADYLQFLEADRVALGRKAFRPKFFGDESWKFQRCLRKFEYHTNCKTGLIGKFSKLLTKYRFHVLSLKCGYSIPCNTFGPGLALIHRGTIVVNSKVRVGAWCRIHVCTNIGSVGGDADAVPTLGDRVYIGPGAKIFGKIHIANGVAIGANSVVNKSVEIENVTVAGSPAKVINDKGSGNLINFGSLQNSHRPYENPVTRSANQRLG